MANDTNTHQESFFYSMLMGFAGIGAFDLLLDILRLLDKAIG